MLNKYFRLPFAVAGDKTAIPEPTQVDGSVSYNTGFTPDYELPYSNPNSKDVPRNQSNQLSFDITTALQEYQQNGVPDWIDPTQNSGVNFPYPLGARARYSNGLIYVSMKAANNSLPTVAADWFEETGRLLRITRFSRIAGVQNVSVNGGADTTVGAGTFTRLQGSKFAIVKALGGGSGGSGGTGATGGNISAGAPGCAGSYGESFFSAATIGASQAVTVGLGTGSNVVGGTTSFGALLTAPGGTASGGATVNVAPPLVLGNGVLAIAPTGANILSIQGAAPHLSTVISAASGFGGAGGASIYGPGGNAAIINTNGTNAVNPGSGGSGAAVNAGGGTATGGSGAAGNLYVYEYA